MSQPTADRNLLFGVLALQMEFIKREQLIAAMQAWVFDKSKPIGEILCAQKALAEDNRVLLESLVQKHLAQHGNDLEKSLAAVSSASDVKTELLSIQDPDVQASLAHVSKGSGTDVDIYATIAPSAPATVTPGKAPGVGTKTGGAARFRILRPHARGGLGEVFVARDEELNREVALKEIQDKQADNVDSRSRFMLEAEITGGLEHPGIVPVYGLGAYADGRPYYAMRFIRGDSLKEAIERFHKADAAGIADGERALQLRGLLGRFVDVCNAIAYAHSRGVLHRDLKPGNIMLGKYGETLVVDWGLAKPLGAVGAQTMQAGGETQPGEGSLMPASISATSQTMMGAAVGTPQYMSPEQASGRLDQLGPASDVYSLGATLYCLLSGRSPVSDPDVGVVLQKVQRGDIPRLREIKHGISIPLEAICTKAMALKLEDRYSSPRLLADDIEHWLADEPVSAYPEPWTVKARRWIGRHRTLVTGIAAAVVVAVIGLTVATILLTAANERERQAKVKAEENFQLARKAVDRYHTEVSESVLLHEPMMEPLRKKLLEAAQEYYDKFVQERGNDPTVRAELGKATFRLAQITGDIGSKKKAVELHEKAVKIFATLPVADVTAQTRSDLAACYHHLGRLHRIIDQLAKSEEYYKKALSLWEPLVKDNAKEDRYQAGLARTEMGLGNVHQVARRLDVAEIDYKKAIAGWEALARAHPETPEYQRDVATCYSDIAVAYKSQPGKEKEAETAYRDALTIQTKLVNQAPYISQYQDDLARTAFNLGDLLIDQDLMTDARISYLEAAKRWQTLVERHPAVTIFHIRLADAHAALSRVYLQAKDTKKAEEASQHALTIKRKLAEDNKDVVSFQGDVARGLVTLGEVYRAAGQADKAEAALKDAVVVQERLAREQTQAPHYQRDLARTYHGLGLVYAMNNNEDKAVEAYKKALTQWEKLVRDHEGEQEYAIGMAQTCIKLGNMARFVQKKFQDANGWYTRAAASLDTVQIKAFGSLPVRDLLRDAFSMRAETLTKMGQYQEAMPDWDRALEFATGIWKPRFQIQRAAGLARVGKHTEAAAEVDKLVAPVKKNGKLVEPFKESGAAQYQFACVYALSAAAASNDPQLATDRREVLSDQYASQAMKRLNAASDAGFFKTPANIKNLKSDHDLDALRPRPEFQKLTTELKGK